MIAFEKYFHKIQFSDCSTPLSYKAYCLDGAPRGLPDLRRDAGIGSCNCCDYFRISNCGDLVLIEDTRLGLFIERQQQKFSYLDEKDQDKHIRRLICSENATKVYGSLYTIYKFLNQQVTIDQMPKINSIQFWLVVSDDEKYNVRALDQIRRLLKDDLFSKLGRKVIERNVEVLFRNEFIGRFKREFG